MLYRLSEALLSAQKHYDWKLRAVKTTLNVAGGMRRLDMKNTESRVLLRALRDFNLGKLVADDVANHLQLGGRPVHVVPLGLSPPPAHAETVSVSQVSALRSSQPVQPEATHASVPARPDIP